MSTSSVFCVRVDMVPVNSVIENLRRKGIEVLPEWKNDLANGVAYLFSEDGEWNDYAFSGFTSVNGEKNMEVTVCMERHYSKLIRVKVYVDHPEDQIPGPGFLYPYEANA